MKLKKGYCLGLCLVLSILSCSKKENVSNVYIGVKHLSHEDMKNIKKIDIAVINKLDPICEMNTKEHLADTVNYKGNIYGFCSTMCKEQFLKNPKKYISE